MGSMVRDVSVGVFFIVLSGLLVLGGPKVFEEWKALKTQELASQAEIVNSAKSSVNAVLSEIKMLREHETKRFDEIKKNAEITSRFVEEVSVLAGVRFLEEQRVLAPETADEMAREAIKNIRTSHSERLGKILEAVNDRYLRDRR